MLRSIFLCILVCIVLGSSYLGSGNFNNALTESDPTPSVLSYHIHLLYSYMEQDIADAISIRNELETFLHPYLIPGREFCDGVFDQGRLCIRVDSDVGQVDLGKQVGPFPCGEWSVFVPVPYLGIVYPWLIQNRDRFSVFLHPSTGYMYWDHTIWASWTGTPWPLNLAPEIVGIPGKRTHEIGHIPGDEGNPMWIPNDLVCGVNNLVQAPCCEGSSCECLAGLCLCSYISD